VDRPVPFPVFLPFPVDLAAMFTPPRRTRMAGARVAIRPGAHPGNPSAQPPWTVGLPRSRTSCRDGPTYCGIPRARAESAENTVGGKASPPDRLRNRRHPCLRYGGRGRTT
jgi:hypothetical protein